MAAEDEKYSRRNSDVTCDILLFDRRIEVRVSAVTLEEDDVKKIINRVQQLAGTNRYPVLVVPDKDTKISFFGMRLLASEAAMNYTMATAYIIRSFHHQVMAESFFTLYTTSRPVRVFKKESEALEWLTTVG